MKHSEKDKWLDRIISQTAASNKDKPVPDFDKWLKEHPNAVNSLKSQADHLQSTNISDYKHLSRESLLVRFPWLVCAYRIAALLFIVACCTACFVLSGKNADLRDELEIARRDVAIAQTDDSATINLYLKEHQDIVARHVSFSPATPKPAQMRVSRRDILYYELFDNGPEYMRPGIIVRGPSSQREISSPEAPVISNGHTMTLSEAQEATDFDLVSPLWLDPCYTLDQIRRIEGREAMQLLYTDGINSVSLFEQPLDGQYRLELKDFRDYAVYSNKKQTGGTILAWRDDALSYVLIGNAEMSQLMDMAQSISAGK